MLHHLHQLRWINDGDVKAEQSIEAVECVFYKQLSICLDVYVLLDMIKAEDGNNTQINSLVLKISTHTVRITFVDNPCNE